MEPVVPTLPRRCSNQAQAEAGSHRVKARLLEAQNGIVLHLL